MEASAATPSPAGTVLPIFSSPRLERLFAALPDPVRRVAYRLRARPGHYYSPYPDLAQLRAREDAVFGPRDDLPGIDLREPEQLALVERLAAHADALPWGADPRPGLRYHYGNRPYPYGDGVFLALMLCELRPRRYVEVGSGYSTALALDARDHLVDDPFDIVTIDPFPDRLRSVLGEERPDRFELMEAPVQDVELSTFDRLGSGDVLLVDSTHVARAGGDVNHLVFEVLPRLADGVYVHFHDVFAGFEYPREWVFGGRAWSEAYLLRAFLQFNQSFEVVLTTSWLQQRHADWFAANLPQCGPNPGASLWIRRVPPADRAAEGGA